MIRFFISLIFYLMTVTILAFSGPVGKYGYLFAGIYIFSFLCLWAVVHYFPEGWTGRKTFLVIFLFCVALRGLFIGFHPSFDVNRLLFKIVMATVDAFVLLPLSFIFKRQHIPIKRLLWYGANPLLLVYIAGEGHFDSLLVFFICLGVYCILAKRDRLGFVAMGCAVLVRFFAIFAIPFLFRSDNWKKGGWLFLPLVAYQPFMEAGGGLCQSLLSFGADVHYNDSVTSLLRLLGHDLALWGSALALAGGLAGTFLLVHDRLRSVFWAFGWLLICLPTLHPWYLACIIPFAAIFSSAPWLYLCAAMPVTFPVLASEYRTGQFQEIHWLKILEYVLFFFLLGVEYFRSPQSVGEIVQPVHTIAAVIPTYNEQDRITACLDALSVQPEITEIIIADGGSSDQTTVLAEKRGGMVVLSPLGRGQQISRGIAQATADVVLIVHADCRLDPGSASQVIHALNRNPMALGGGIGMRFSSKSVRKWVLSVLNNFRARYFGIAFGDQGQFVRRAALLKIGGFPAQYLMEDVELSFRLKEAGAQVFLPNGIEVSGRRWDKAFLPGVVKVLRLFGAYLIERRLGSLDPSALQYYKRYYGNETSADNDIAGK